MRTRTIAMNKNMAKSPTRSFHDREEIADPVGVAAQPLNQLAGPLAAKVFERERLQMLVGHVRGSAPIRSLTQAST